MSTKILIIYTGGTIGMETCSSGDYHPTSGFEALARKAIAPMIWKAMPNHDYLELSPAIDSADINSQHWTLIAHTIIEHYDDYTGFIVLHGTDTMAYSASMLSFLLGPINKTVIFTGSQIPLLEPCSDAANNLLVSLQIIEQTNISEVCIYFANQLFRGNRATKISTSAMIAFESANYPLLGKFENGLKLLTSNWLKSHKPAFNIPNLHDEQVATIYVTPGMPANVISALVESQIKGIVLISYGAGNIPESNHEFIKELHKAYEKSIIIVNVSQCNGGHVSSSYASSKPLRKAGVINGEDMTIEAAFTKLLYLVAKFPNDSDTIKKLLPQSYRGEITQLTGE